MYIEDNSVCNTEQALSNTHTEAHNQFSAPHKHAINIHVNTLTNMLNIIYMCAGIVSVGRTDGTAHIASHRD